ncbi:Protein FAM32A-like protein [Zostera marina]|uniref:Protein FAM32A-like protein n=1 Tax=Zostera marina TaxID=29655 RepID=A0A0K9PYT4_ZOSMR|nr:Protein FAM32A-like protein [Zostera marina]
MSGYENVVVGKLKLKGKALDVKSGGVKKKKKHSKNRESSYSSNDVLLTGDDATLQMTDPGLGIKETEKSGDEGDGHQPNIDDHLTPAERRYIEQRERIDIHRMAKTANKSHRDRIGDFNQYLANMSEHYDIPKVGPG